MTRSNAREIALHLIFEHNATGVPSEELLGSHFSGEYYETLSVENPLYAEQPSEKQKTYIRDVVLGVEAHAEELDEVIAAHAVGWSLNRISKVARAVLQLAIYEMRYVEDVPAGTAINEAVELTKKYDDTDVVSFVNGILGAVARA